MCIRDRSLDEFLIISKKDSSPVNKNNKPTSVIGINNKACSSIINAPAYEESIPNIIKIKDPPNSKGPIPPCVNGILVARLATDIDKQRIKNSVKFSYLKFSIPKLITSKYARINSNNHTLNDIKKMNEILRKLPKVINPCIK